MPDMHQDSTIFHTLLLSSKIAVDSWELDLLSATIEFANASSWFKFAKDSTIVWLLCSRSLLACSSWALLSSKSLLDSLTVSSSTFTADKSFCNFDFFSNFSCLGYLFVATIYFSKSGWQGSHGEYRAFPRIGLQLFSSLIWNFKPEK